MTERMLFSFDPRCPWCYQTSRWARRLAELGEVQLEWGLFALEMVNASGEDAQQKAAAAKRDAGSSLSLRTAVLVRDEHGSDGLGRFYAALGQRVHEQVEPVESADTIQAALRDSGMDPDLVGRAAADDSTWDRLVAEHRELVETTRSFGVPTISLLDGDGNREVTIFGPVISNVPSDTDAVELFRHVAWLARYDNFSELKRDRAARPDLESVRRRYG